jgi:single-stranded DNA-binding protein
MGTDTNYIGLIVKNLEIPKQKIVNKNILVTECRAQFSQTRNTKIIKLVFWDKLAREVSNYYTVNDYLLVEGYLSLSKVKTLKTKKAQISVLKVYPFRLSSNRSVSLV